jgi:hypothetical protein
MDSDLNNRSAETGNRRSQITITMRNILYFGVFIYLFLASQCVEKDKCFKEYHLQFQASITPPEDTITLSDTLWFEMRVGNDIFDNNSNSIIPINGVEFPFYFSIGEIDSINLYSSELKFDYTEIIGSLLFQQFSSFTRIKLNMTDLNNEHLIKFGFSPKNKGIYRTTLYTLNEEVENLEVGNPECRSFIKNISFAMNELDTSNGYYLLPASGNPQYRDYSEENFKKAGTFAFVVVD